MARLYISEYALAVRDTKQTPVPAGVEPALRRQTVVFTTAVDSLVFDGSCTLVRIYADANCFVDFGEDPLATADGLPVSARSPEYFGIEPGHKLSVYDGTS